jgi:hypothetical protein
VLGLLVGKAEWRVLGKEGRGGDSGRALASGQRVRQDEHANLGIPRPHHAAGAGRYSQVGNRLSEAAGWLQGSRLALDYPGPAQAGRARPSNPGDRLKARRSRAYEPAVEKLRSDQHLAPFHKAIACGDGPNTRYLRDCHAGTEF